MFAERCVCLRSVACFLARGSVHEGAVIGEKPAWRTLRADLRTIRCPYEQEDRNHDRINETLETGEGLRAPRERFHSLAKVILTPPSQPDNNKCVHPRTIRRAHAG